MSMYARRRDALGIPFVRQKNEDDREPKSVSSLQDSVSAGKPPGIACGGGDGKRMAAAV
jgi:hypothetical protein